MAIQALIFDVDGTLAETEESHRLAFNRAFAARGLDWNWGRDLYRELLRTTGGKERMIAYQATLPAGRERLDEEEIAKLHRDKTAIYTDILSKGELVLRPGVAELIAAGGRAGLKLAIASTTSPANIEALCQCCWRCKATELFEVIAAGDEVSNKKPAPDVYALALERLALPASACLAFEDSLNGVRAAQGAGLRVIVTPGIYTAHEDCSAAEAIIPSLTGADLPTWLVAEAGLAL